MATCKSCGRDNQDLYKFCLGCGGELGESAGGGASNSDAAGGGASNSGASNSGASGDAGGGFSGGGTNLGGPRLRTDQTPMPRRIEDIPTARSANGTVGGSDEYDMRDRRDSLAHLQPIPALGMSPSPGELAGASGRFSSARLCPTCGNAVPSEFTFCGQCGTRLDASAKHAAVTAQPRAASGPSPSAGGGTQGRLILIRPDGTEGGVHPLSEGENLIGRGMGALFDADGYLSPRHAEIVLNAAGGVVRDTGSLNGVFVKLTDEEPIVDGDVFRIGQELLRFDEIPAPVPLDDGTDVMGSPNPGYWGRLALIVGRDQDGSAFPLFGDGVTLGRERGDILFPEDGYVSGQHARIGLRDGRFYLEDLNSSNGTFIRVRGERELKPGSAILMGQQLFRISY